MKHMDDMDVIIGDEISEAYERGKRDGFKEAVEAAAKVCDTFVEAYSFATPYPDGYVYSEAETRAFMIGAGGRFAVAAAKIRTLEEEK